MREKYPLTSALILWLSCMLALSGPDAAFGRQSAAVVAAGTASGSAGQDVSIAVSFTPGSASACTMQFDLQIPAPLVYKSAAAGPAATAAQKIFGSGVLSDGVRILLFDMNSTTLGAGSVAVVTISIPSGTPAGSIPITVTNIVLSDALVNPLSVVGMAGSITVIPPPDTTPPTISGVTVTNVAESVATILWTTNEPANSQVAFGTTYPYGSWSEFDPNLVLSHSQTLTGLTRGTTYRFKAISSDAAGNQGTSTDLTFTTTNPLDTKPPEITGVAATGITTTGATILWTTDEVANSQVNYGLTTAYGSSTTVDHSRVTTHSQDLTGLTPGTTYHYRVQSADASNNTATSTDYFFQTRQPTSTDLPEILSITVSRIGSSGATIAWITNVPSDSQISYGLTTDCGSSSKLNRTAVTAHSQNLSGLQPSTTYYFKVQSSNSYGTAVSELRSFTTAASKNKKLVYPRLAASTAKSDALSIAEYTGIAVVNFGSMEAVLTFTAYNKDGSEVAGDNITNPTTRILPAGMQLPVLDRELFGSGLPNHDVLGWIEVDSNVNEVTGFTLIFDPGLSMMDGAPVCNTTLTQFLFPEIEDTGFTDLHIANPNSTEANIRFQLVQSNGMIKAASTRKVNPLGAVGESVASLFPGIVPEVFDYIRVTSDVGVIPFELLGKHYQYLEGLNGIDTYAGATTLYSPQYAVGKGYRSSLTIINLDPTNGNLTLRLYAENGAQIGATRIMPIAANGKVYISDPLFFGAAGEDIVQGYVEIRASGAHVVGNVVFGDPEHSTFATALPLVSELESSLMFSQVASDQVFFTGISLLNPNGEDAVATIDLYKADGSLDDSVTAVIGARQRLSRILTGFFPKLAGESRSSGYIRVSANQGLAGFSVFGTHNLQTLSAVPGQAIR